MPNHAADPKNCAWLRLFIGNSNIVPWPHGPLSVAKAMVTELGSREGTNQLRLTVFTNYTNQMKGSLFHDVTVVGDIYGRLEPGDEQLAYLKKYGMIFAYFNIPEVWSVWCETFNAIRGVLLQFDTWYNTFQNPNAPVHLANEWAAFNRKEFERIAKTARRDIRFMFSSRKRVAGFWKLWWDAKWLLVTSDLLGQMGYVGFNQPCQNLW
jgi:hypothetical protein